MAFRHVNFFYPVAFLLATSWYATVSHRLAKAGASDIDAIVISEQIVVCGIASLIGLVMYAVISTNAFLSGAAELSPARIADAAYVFAEGLACAAIAPVVAMVLRFVQNPMSQHQNLMSQHEKELQQLGETAATLSDFSRKAATLSRNMQRLSNAMDQSVSSYDNAVAGVVSALHQLETQIGSQSNAVSGQLGELDAKARVLADAMARTTAELRRAGSDVVQVYSATDGAIRGLAGHVDELSQKLRTNGELLDGLGTLVASVNDFIRPTKDQPGVEQHSQ